MPVPPAALQASAGELVAPAAKRARQTTLSFSAEGDAINTAGD
jgi:hypothetical protein